LVPAREDETVGRKRIFKDDAARQRAHRADLKKKQIQRKRQGDYSTPPDLFEELDRLYHFTIDVCATADNAKCPHYFTPEQDGLTQPWSGATWWRPGSEAVCWMNPPYHQAEIHKWIRKAYEESSSQRGTVVVALLPARTGSWWFHELVLPHATVTFLRGRIKFAEMTTNPPEDSMIAVFGIPSPCSLHAVHCPGYLFPEGRTWGTMPPRRDLFPPFCTPKKRRNEVSHAEAL
jgi:site-specific DNA-methyltransferase (adenine-specific)